MKRILTAALVLLLSLMLAASAYADKADFEYKLIVTDQNGAAITNPRSMNAGDTLNVEIELTRTDTDAASYETYGLEFRLRSHGLEYNGDGASFRSGTPITRQTFDIGDSVGFAYYDMQQIGERINNPVLAGKWSYTVSDPSAVNITVPVALMYIVNDSESYEPVGNAILYLDPNGGEIVGEDVSGEYRSGTIVTLPDAEFAEYNFLGWSDGYELHPAGGNFTVTGIVTLTAQWEGLVRDRQVIFDPNGGSFLDDDPTGMYADGEVIVIPDAARDGYTLDGWQLMGGELYEVGSEYVVDNSVVFVAQWTDDMAGGSGTGEENPGSGWFTNPDGTPNSSRTAGSIIGGLGLLGLGLWLIIILWKRRWVLYSLKSGDVALSYKDKEHDVNVEAILYSEDEDGHKVELHLNKSGLVEVKHRLRFIYGQEEVFPIVDVEPGKYKGKLIVTGENYVKEIECRIKVLDREIREREND